MSCLRKRYGKRGNIEQSLPFALSLQLATVCPAFGVPVSGVGYDAAFAEVTVTDAGIAALMALDTSSSFWVGYDNGGFNVEFLEATPALTLTLYTADGRELWFDVFEHAGVYYALPFANVVAYADANGEHMGTHPCAAFTLTRAQFARLLAALG